jgi:hypothetical protein
MEKRKVKRKKKRPTLAELNRLKRELQRVSDQLQSRTRELAEATEQQAATSEVLKVIASSPIELQPLYETILANTTRLCEANIASLFLYDGAVISTAASYGTTQECAAHLAQSRPSPSRETTTRLALWNAGPSMSSSTIRTHAPQQRFRKADDRRIARDDGLGLSAAFSVS